jgi:hypothetical protein
MENTTTKKTAKYYRDIFNGGNISLAISILPEVIKKFGYKLHGKYSKTNDYINLKGYTEFNWNHQIEGFFLTDKGMVCADIYWQGDSTDGSTSEYVNDLRYGKTIPAEHEWLGDRTYYKHSDLRISREEFEDAIKALGKFLAPDAIKARKVAAERAEKFDKVFEHIDAKKKGLDRWEMENFWNGRIAVQKVLENNPELLNKSFEELKPIVEKVYSSNEKSDYSLRGGWYSGEKKYNLAY